MDQDMASVRQGVANRRFVPIAQGREQADSEHRRQKRAQVVDHSSKFDCVGARKFPV